MGAQISSEVSETQLAGLDMQVGAPKVHPALGFVVQLDADLVHDITRRGKWKLLRPNARTVVLNPEYKLSPEETLVHKLWFLYKTLSTEPQMRNFFFFSNEETRQQQAKLDSQRELGVILANFAGFRSVFEQWQETLGSSFCNCRALEQGPCRQQLGSWLEKRGMKAQGSPPGDMFARLCAFRTGSLNPLPKVQAWVEEAQLVPGPKEAKRKRPDSATAVKLFAAAHMQQHQQQERQRQPQQPERGPQVVVVTGPFDMLRKELNDAANRAYSEFAYRHFILCPDEPPQASDLTPGLLRSRHLPRSTLCDMLVAAGLDASPNLSARSLDRLYREIVCEHLNPRSLELIIRVQTSQGKSDLLNPVSVHRERFRNTILYARSELMHSGFQEPETCAEYLDKLLEYGCLFLLENDQMFADEARQRVAVCAGCQSPAHLMAKLRSLLDHDFLESWLCDRGHTHSNIAGLSLQQMLDLYRQISMSCLMGQACPDPSFPAILVMKTAGTAGTGRGTGSSSSFSSSSEQKSEEPTLVVVQLTESATPKDPNDPTPAEFEQALALYTRQFDEKDPEDHARLARLATLIKVDLNCGADMCDDRTLAQKVANRLFLLQSEDAFSKQLDAHLARQGVVTELAFLQKLRVLSSLNQNKIDTLKNVDVLATLLKLAGNESALATKLTQLNLMKPTDPPAREHLICLLETYANQPILLQVARKYSREVPGTATVRELVISL